MSSRLQSNLLYTGGSVAIRDVCCRASRHPFGPDEWTLAHLIVFLRAGAFVKRVEGRSFVADANQVVFFNRGETYQVEHPADSGDDCTTFKFDPGLVREVAAMYQPRVVERPERPFEFTHAPSSQRTFLLQERLRQRLLSGVKDRLLTEELALDLLVAVVRSAYRARGIPAAPRHKRTVSAHRERAEAARRLLVEHFAEDLDLTEIARMVYSSPFHLARLFRSETGLAIHQYRTRLRLRAALERVTAGETDLTQLAFDLGFSSHSHLTGAFRAAFGLPPSECRRRASAAWLRDLSKNLEAPGPFLS